MAGNTTIDANGRRTRLFLAAVLVALGVALRLWWMQLSGTLAAPLDVGEASRAARAMAEHGTIADAFFPGQGPTAHLMPVMVTISASVLRAFGPDSPRAALALSALAIVQTVALWLLTRTLFARIGSGGAVQLAGLAILALIPAFVVQECADFRVWEGALAACLGTLNLWLAAELDQRAEPPGQALLLAAFLAAATFFTSPTAGVATGACWAWFALRRLDWKGRARFAGTAALILALFVAPWMLRNQQQLGSPIALRSNFGLEFAVANHPAAIPAADPLAALRARMVEIHPYANAAAQARLEAAGGEVAYARGLGHEAEAWALAHPLDFARLALHHYRQFYIPEPWQGALTNWQTWNGPRIAAIRIVAILGLAGLALGLWQRRRFYAPLALYIAAAGLPYALVQPIPRYSYLVWGLFAFLAADLVAALAGRLRGALLAPITLR